MTRWAMTGVIALAFAGVTLLAQGRPDLSGEWTMDAARSRASSGAAAGGMMGGGGMSAGGPRPANAVSGGASMSGGGAPGVTSVRITQTSSALTIERVSGAAPEKVVYKLDGTESVNVTGRTTTKVTSRWDGARLVSEGTSETQISDGSGAVSATYKEVRWLDKDGSLVVETTRALAGQPPRVTTTYFKKGRGF